MKISARLRYSLTGVLLLMLFQNCGKFEVASDQRFHLSSYNFSQMGQDALQPATDKADASCMTKTDYDACLFVKNPVAQKQRALSSTNIASQNYDTLQIYGVKLTGRVSANSLDNGTIRVEALAGIKPLSLKVKAQNDFGRNFSQVNVYYWLNRATEYLSRRTGVFPANGKNIRVVVDDNLSGWAPHTNTIHLRVNESGNAMAWSPELAIHYFALANLYFGTEGAIEPPNDLKHTTCNLKSAGCCISQIGCSRAIASGVGDYMAAVIFPTQPRIGETWANSPDGISSCGLSRDLESAAKRSASAAFSACQSQARNGDVSAMGSIYASIWWEVRKAAQNVNPAKGDIEVDTLFMNHLSDLDGNDDFQTALTKIRNLDSVAFQGRYSRLFEAQFAAHGL